MKKRALALSIMMVAGIGMTGCVTTTGGQSKVAVADIDSRAHQEPDLNMGDLMAFAENVTNKMLTDRKLKGWHKKKPKLVVGKILNNTDDPNLNVADMTDRIVEVIFNAEMAKIVDQSAEEFNYILRSEISSNRQYGEKGKQLVEYRMTMKIFTVDGEMVGNWSDRFNLAKAERNMF
ncbi:MAG: hypothetical protein JMN25_00335 [gamma proteobacterium endosymbiont of Lamellibrachia anaximandri]|nr:hypothetical protein [gamma proteobacterium endosymbiont of Lamellibrachia anaximandri]